MFRHNIQTTVEDVCVLNISAIVSQQESCGLKPVGQLEAFLCEVCMFLPRVHEFPPGSLASSHSPTVNW